MCIIEAIELVVHCRWKLELVHLCDIEEPCGDPQYAYRIGISAKRFSSEN